ncbi:hypothetical protein BT96DRAFT_303105 [Gymnopus androsaceus JB14]|uniref:Uncharacterized protein n=1 Tax=Gymnopus androsaceus JB14 TaxID=1447944 RepID=A0A6A4GA33_9AGAR|nr:hypothetical protein BT96DRAFT_303105 [Gymnopus androsaceus JB14]
MLAIIMLTLFGISTNTYTLVKPFTSAHGGLFPTIVMAGLLEIMAGVLGYGQAYLLASCHHMRCNSLCTVLAPTYLVAGNFIMLGYIINQLGPDYSRLPPRWYAIIFCSFDLISLVVQAIRLELGCDCYREI